MILHQMRGVAPSHCQNCGNPDCPEVSKTPYWTRCPATDRIARASLASVEREDSPQQAIHTLADWGAA